MTWLRHRTVLFLFAVALSWGGWEAYLRLSAPGRLTPELRSALGRGPVNVAVTLGFPPEDFHVRLFQTIGVVSGVRGTTVLLDRVTTDDVTRMARYYWVRQIALRS